MSFFGSLFGGSNPTLNKDINQFGSIGGFATGLGENNLSQSSQFFSSILSGDPSKTAKALAPQISSIQQQTQQQKNQNAQFGNRSGGTNASNQMANDKATGSINDMISSLLGGAASSLSSSGSNLLNAGLGAYGQQVNASQLQMQNWQSSLFGGALTGGLGIGLGSAAKAAGLGL